MENKVTAISGWHEGMIDSIEGDFQFESNKPMNSVLWLENFNPNQILQSIVLRDAMGIVNDSALAPLPYNYTVYLPLNIIDGYLYPKYLGCMAFSTTRPLDHDILVVFVNGKYNDINEVRVISQTVDEDNTPIWHEPHTIPFKGSTIPVDVKMVGRLGDWHNYANNLLITTIKDTLDEIGHKNAYPVYVYAYDDLGEKYKYILMPYDYKVLSDKKMWKVRKNTKYLLTEDKVRTHTLQYGDTTLFDPMKFYPNTIRGKLWVELFGYSQMYASSERHINWHDKANWGGSDSLPIPLVLSPNTELETLKYSKYVLETEMTNDKLKEKIDLLFWQTDELPKGHKNKHKAWLEELPYFPDQKIQDTHYNVGDQNYPVKYLNEIISNHILTVEKLNHDEEKWIPYCRIGNLDKTSVGHIFYDTFNPLMGTVYGNPYYHLYVPMQFEKQKIRYSATDEVHTIDALPMQGSYGKYTLVRETMPSTYAYLQHLGTDGVENNSWRRVGSPAGFRYNKFPDTSLTALMLPDYVKHQTPRYWINGEKIPYVVTAVIDGIETEVKRGVYEIPPSYDFPNIDFQGADDIQNKIFTQWICLNPIDQGSAPAFEYSVCLYKTYSHAKGGNPNGVHAGYHPYTYSEVFTQHDGPLVDNNQNQILQREGLHKLFHLYYKEIVDGKLVEEDKETETGKFHFYPMWSRMPFTMFTLRLNYENIEEALDDLPTGLTQIKVYVSAADNSIGLINRDIRGTSFSPLTQGYSLPAVTDNNNNNYKLVKTFTIKGTEGDKTVETRWLNYERQSQGSAGKGDSNYWQMTTYIGTSDPIAPRALGDECNTGLYAIPYEEELYMYPQRVLNLRNIKSNVAIEWTPDFYLWDYPSVSESLIDNVSATGPIQLWKGKGAKLVTATRGATVIGGCQDEFGKEEVGKIRVSLNQNGNQTVDVFTEWDFLQVSRNSSTALLNYNDTIIVFSKEGYNKVVLNDLTNALSWQVFAEVYGQGVDSKKHTCVTPYGIFFANRKGIFVTDGLQHEEVSGSIGHTYRKIIQNSDLHSDSWKNNLNIPAVNLELLYVSSANELHVHCFGSYGSDHVLIYDFQYKNWRVYSYPLSTDHECYTTYKTLYDSPKGKVHGYIHRPSTLDYTIYNPWRPYITNTGHDIFMRKVYGIKSNNDYLAVTPSLLDMSMDSETKEIVGKFVTHDIGDGQNDYLLDTFMLEAYPIEGDGNSSINARYDVLDRDPIVSIATRHQSNSTQLMPQIEHVYDLFAANMKNLWRKWLHRTSPTNVAPGNTNKTVRTRESFYYKVPFGISFRKGVIYFQTKGLSMIRELKLTYREYKRRNFS